MVLEELGLSPREVRSSGKAPLTDPDVRQLLAQVDTVIVARGKAERTLAAKDATLDDLRGPTGGFRAPIVRRGRTLLVGFSEVLLRRLVAD